jgi:Flp pilus assembly pilin Flp
MMASKFWRDEGGQDLLEYTLLLAMVCLMSAAMMVDTGTSIRTIWHTTGNNLSSARSVAGR